MDVGSIELILGFARMAAVTLAACGLFLIFLDIGRTPEPSRLRRRIARIWQDLAGTPIGNAPVFAVAAAIAALNRFVVYWFEQSERNVVTAGAFTLVVFVAIPLAAILNWLRGGSPILVVTLLGCVVAIVALAVLSETKRYPSAASFLSPVLFGAVFLVVPSYVFYSLTDRALNIAIAHGALISLLIAPLLYLVGHSVILAGAGVTAIPVPSIRASDVRRIATLFVAFLPFAYIGTFAGLLSWHVVAPELPEPSSWRVLLVVTGGTALSAACAIHLAVPRGGRALSFAGLLGRLGLGMAVSAVSAGVIVVADGVPHGGPSSLLLLPFAMSAVLVALAGGALVAKLVLAVAQLALSEAALSDRPYAISGVLALILATCAGWAATAL